MSAAARNAALTLGAVALAAAYPLLVYVLIRQGRIRHAGLVLLAVVLVRFLAGGSWRGWSLAVLVAGTLMVAAIATTNSELLVRLYPVVVNVVLLSAFAVTLWRPPSMIERIARSTGVALDAAGVQYVRNVTVVWVGFFVVNGGIALATAMAASREVWALYNGLLSYLIAGVLFGAERLVRSAFRRRMARVTQ